MKIFGVGTPSVDRRSAKFTETLSMFMSIVAAVGAFLILLDPQLTLTISGQIVKIGGEGFSSELKGAVVTIMLLGGWTAVQKFWLSSSDAEQAQTQSLSRIAESPSSPDATSVKVSTPSNVTVTTEGDANAKS